MVKVCTMRCDLHKESGAGDRDRTGMASLEARKDRTGPNDGEPKRPEQLTF